MWVTASLPLIAGLGCSEGSPWGRFMQPASGEKPAAAAAQPATIVSTPLPQQKPEEDSAPDSDLSQMNDRIAQYAGRFPDGSPAEPSAAAPAQRGAWQPLAQREPSPTANKPSAADRPAPLPAEPAVSSAQHQARPRRTVEANAPAELGSASSPQPMRVPQAPATAKGDLKVSLLDVRPAQASPPAASSGANQATGAATASPTASLADLIAAQEKLIAQNPRSVDEQLKLRLLYLSAGQAQRATAPFSSLDAPRNEVLAALMRTLTATAAAANNPGQPATPALAATNDLQRLLSRQAPVAVAKMALVTSVNSFGDYVEVPSNRFPADRPVHVFCYIEVNNFHSQPSADGRSRTLLGARLEAFDAAGKRVWEQSIAKIEDLARTPRRDFFLPLEIKMPTELPAGEYVLKVTIDDQLGGTSDQQRLTFTIK